MLQRAPHALIIILVWSLSQALHALTPYVSLWGGGNYQNYLTQDKKWVYLLHAQARFIDTIHPVETLLTEDSIGYSLNDKQRIWV